MGNFRFVLYAACLVSLSVYAYRAYRRWLAPDRHERRAEAEGTPATTTDAAGSLANAVRAAPTPSPVAPELPKVKRGLGFTNPNTLPSEQERGASESLVQQVIREEVAKQRAAGDPESGSSSSSSTTAGGTASSRTGLFASGDAAPAERVSVAAALTGVRLPDDLVPLVDGTTIDPHHVTFLASSGPAGAIGRHLGDELERLGFEVRSEGDTVAVATKGDVRLRITLHPDAATERVDGVARYPTAGPAGVVVEFQT